MKPNEDNPPRKKKGKPPAFQFYPDSWLSSTDILLMTPAEEGAYIRLLCHAWLQPDFGLPDDDAALAMLSRLGSGWKKAAPKIRQKFQSEGGRLFNHRLLAEREKQKYWSTKSSEGGKKSATNRATNTQPTGQPNDDSGGEINQPKSKGGCEMVIQNVNQRPSLQSSVSSLQSLPTTSSSSAEQFSAVTVQQLANAVSPPKPTTTPKSKPRKPPPDPKVVAELREVLENSRDLWPEYRNERGEACLSPPDPGVYSMLIEVLGNQPIEALWGFFGHVVKQRPEIRNWGWYPIAFRNWLQSTEALHA